MCLSNKFLVFISLLILASTQLAAAPPENPPPIEVDVFVVNDEANAVPVTIHGAPAEPTPFQRSSHTLLDIGDDGDDVGFSSPPVGKRLVIEHVSVDLSLDAGANAVCTVRVTDGSITTMSHTLVVVPQGFLFGVEAFSVSQQITLFVESGQEVSIHCAWKPAISFQVQMRAAISGYLVDE